MTDHPATPPTATPDPLDSAWEGLQTGLIEWMGTGGPSLHSVLSAHRAAIEAAARREPPALDVERLARAIDEAGTVTWDDDPKVTRPKWPTELARDAAPIYDRLTRARP